MPIVLNGSAGITSPDIELAAGTTTTYPIKLASGTNLTSATAGVVEYDGKVPYFTPQGTQRGLIPGMQFYCLQNSYAFNMSTSATSIYNVGVTLSSSTIYAFEALFILVKSSTLAAVSNLGFGGTATVNNIVYQTHSVFDPGSIPQVDSSVLMGICNTTAMTPFTSSASVGAVSAFVTGTVSINVGGTFIPQYSQNVIPGGSNTLTNQVGSYFRIYPIGAAGSNISIGTWA